MKRFFLAGAAAATMAGCAVPAAHYPVLQRPPFPIEEYVTLPTTGNAVVTGQVFLKTRGGDVKLGAGNPVILNPVTSYSTFTYEFRKGKLSPPDPRQIDYLRQTIADGSGRFAFKNVPDGDYYVVGTVTWEAVQGGAYPYMAKQGGTIVKRISIRNGETVEVMLTE